MDHAGARAVVATPERVRRVREALERAGEPVPPWRATESELARFRAAVARALVESGDGIPDALIPQAAADVAAWICGLGPLQALVNEEDVEEVMVRNGFVLVERRGRVEVVGPLGPDDLFRDLAARAADLGGRALWGTRPYVLVDLPDGHRFSAMVPPLSVEGTAINIRVFRKRMTLGDLVRLGTFDPAVGPEDEWDDGLAADAVVSMLRDEEVDVYPEVLLSLATIVRLNEASILIAGEFSSGKTTLLNALLQVLPPERVVAIVETFRELQVPSHLHPLRAVVPEVLEEGGGLPPMREVVNVLYKRMRPDLIVFGEVVGDEAVPLLDAMNLGKRVITTIHGEDAYAALLQLEMLAMASGLPLAAVRERVARGVNLVVHMARAGRRRFLRQVVLVEGYDHETGRYRLSTLYDAAPWMSERVSSLKRWQWG
jgi:pilus assembly protein CpaF